MAEQKEEEEKKRRQNEPKERNYEKEQQEALEKARGLEKNGVIRQCNEGHWNFKFDDDKDNLILEVDFPKYLSTTLIDVDVRPNYISIVAKGKTLRLELFEEVKSDLAKAERSQTTGTLKIIMPKINKTGPALFNSNIEKVEIKQEKKEKKLKKGELLLQAVDINNIIKNKKDEEIIIKEHVEPIDYDDSDVPPLI